MAVHAKRSKRIIKNEEYEKSINPDNLKLYRKYKVDMTNRNLSPTTIYSYEKDIQHWLSWMNEHQFNPSLADVDDDMIEEYIYFVTQAGNNVNRVKRRLSSISAFYQYLKRKRLVTENPIEFIVRPKNGLPVVVQTYLTEEQVEQIDELLRDDEKSILKYAYFLVSMSTAARVRAICSLRWDQLNKEDMTFEDVLEKEQRIVTLFTNKKTIDILDKVKQYREENNIDDDGYIFATSHGNQLSPTTANMWTKSIGEAIGEPTLHAHDWRHSAATIMKNRGADLTVVSEMLNHLSTDVTNRFYIKKSAKETRKKIAEYQV